MGFSNFSYSSPFTVANTSASIFLLTATQATKRWVHLRRDISQRHSQTSLWWGTCTPGGDLYTQWHSLGDAGCCGAGRSVEGATHRPGMSWFEDAPTTSVRTSAGFQNYGVVCCKLSSCLLRADYFQSTPVSFGFHLHCVIWPCSLIFFSWVYGRTPCMYAHRLIENNGNWI